MVSQHSVAHIRSLANAHMIGTLKGAIQIALIDLEYGKPNDAIEVLTAALAKEKVQEADQYAATIAGVTP